ncbi:pentapeptide repeat-containing protein [Streptomyces sp. NPDC058471]|uniref:pentapeptide repeat-containing protein n=1 Tax=Streptomyces sp. NPDC058471 TaxID=3346516 RepID=UPI00365A584A
MTVDDQDARRIHRLPVDRKAAAALSAWAAATDESTLDATYLDLSGADLSGTDLGLALFCPSVARGIRLREADLYRANLGWADMEGADLTRAVLVKAELTETILRAADLTGANLGSAELYDVDARGACFRAARLNGASLLGNTRLEGADLTDVSVADTSFQATLDDETGVAGMSGTVFGPACINAPDGTRRELAGLALELWLTERGAAVQVLNSPVGTTTYYARIDDEFPRSHPSGVVRRRRAGRLVRDEAFTRNLRWEPTEYLRRYELGHNDTDHVEISQAEADAFVRRLLSRP